MTTYGRHGLQQAYTGSFGPWTFFNCNTTLLQLKKVHGPKRSVPCQFIIVTAMNLYEIMNAVIQFESCKYITVPSFKLVIAS